MASNTFVLKIPAIGLESSASLVIKDGKKPFRIDLEASKSDMKNGVFGFDEIPSNYQDICTSNIEALRNAYQPLADKILGQEYLPSWLSIRKGQTVSLKLDWEKEKRAEAYNTVAFENHDDFEITPANLKEADKVEIKCLNANSAPAQLIIKADDEIVGALNVFYPEPKTIEMSWQFIELSGDKKDYEKLSRKLSKTKLEGALKKGFNPALIDIKLKNVKASLADMTSFRQRFKDQEIIVKSPTYHYIEKDKKNHFVQAIQGELKPESDIITLYVVNRTCMTTGSTGEDGGTFEVVAGFSPTGTGVAYGILNDKKELLTTAVVHEIMHALGLRHTFGNEATHNFEKKKTKNYMDYHATKEYTFKWQWDNLHTYSHLK